jgi:hypothetical protein
LGRRRRFLDGCAVALGRSRPHPLPAQLMLNFRNLTQLPAFSEAAAMENPMATRDQEPPPRDYIPDARTRYTQTSTASKWVGVILGAVLLAFIAYMLFAAMNPSPTSEAIRQTPQNPTTTAAPRTTTVPSTAPMTQPK